MLTARGQAGRLTRFWSDVKHDRNDHEHTHNESQDSHPAPRFHSPHPLSQGSGQPPICNSACLQTEAGLFYHGGKMLSIICFFAKRTDCHGPLALAMTANQRESLRGAKRRGNPFLHKTENLQISHKEWGFATFFEAGIVIRCIRKIMRKLRMRPSCPVIARLRQKPWQSQGTNRTNHLPFYGIPLPRDCHVGRFAPSSQ